MPFDYTQRTYHIADIYRSVEQEAYAFLGQETVLVRFVFPTGLRHAHLLPEREVPHKVLTIGEVDEEILKLAVLENYNLPVHLIEDDPILCGAEDLIVRLIDSELKVALNTCGYFPIDSGVVQNLWHLFIQTKPGLMPDRRLLEKATEIRAYWKPGDEEYALHVEAMHTLYSGEFLDKMYLNPYNVDKKTMQETLSKALELGWRFGARLSSIAPETDQHLQNVPEAEDIYHSRYKEVLGLKKPTTKASETVYITARGERVPVTNDLV